MDAVANAVRAQMPLAESAWLCWREMAEPHRLEELFAAHGGGCYSDQLTFDQMVRLTGDALLKQGGSGRRACATARNADELTVSDQAFYGKLRRIPPDVSMAFLAEGADRLRALMPVMKRSVPKSLANFSVFVLDGKTIKWVERRLKAVRKQTAGALGGKALVALSLNNGLAIGMHAHLDGDANEVRFVPHLLAEVRRRTKGPRLFVQDRAFCDPQQAVRCCEGEDQFVVRYNAKTSFHPDAERRVRTSRDAEGRCVTQTWGWLGRVDHPQRFYVRRIELDRGKDEPLVIITSLLDARAYPAADVLELYRMRWGIERVFQQITEVFGLKRLIGSSPAATIFQLAFCLLMYNITQVIRARIAAGQSRPVESISTEKLFDDVKTQTSAWTLFFSTHDTANYLATFKYTFNIRSRLHALLDDLWTPVWIKSPPQPNRRPPPKRRRTSTHVSIYKLLNKPKSARKSSVQHVYSSELVDPPTNAPRNSLRAARAVALLLLFAVPRAFGDESIRTNWPQWRGPDRNSLIVNAAPWPKDLSDFNRRWRVELEQGYSGPIVWGDRVFVCETHAATDEVVRALDRATGKELWRASWKGAMSVPFFAKKNGDWIRATPACDGESLFVAGMRDVLVCLNIETGVERWRVDFPDKLKTPVPSFGFVSSPLVIGDHVYVQAGGGFIKLNKKTGEIIWRTLVDGGGMSSAFSSPVAATIHGVPQLVVQMREKLAGVAPETGEVLWTQVVPSYRGMNILTPTVFGDGVFTSSYKNKTFFYRIDKKDDVFQADEAWTTNGQGYMSSPVVIDHHAYLHLGNGRLCCLDLKTGQQTWRTKPFGEYWSMVANRDRILALDERGELLLIAANAKQFQLLDRKEVADAESWAHLAICGGELFVRDMGGISAFLWE